jgi:hypothetical protein
VLPVEVSLQNLRITRQDYLSAKEYIELMMDKIDEAPESRLKALKEIKKEKVKIAKADNKHVVGKLFQVGDLVWKMILSLGNQSGMFGKWSPSWEGPFRVIRVVSGNAYFMEDLEGRSLSKALARLIKEIIVSRWIGGNKKHGRLRVIVQCKHERMIL